MRFIVGVLGRVEGGLVGFEGGGGHRLLSAMPRCCGWQARADAFE